MAASAEVVGTVPKMSVALPPSGTLGDYIWLFLCSALSASLSKN
jgi:hypothetical protein